MARVARSQLTSQDSSPSSSVDRVLANARRSELANRHTPAPPKLKLVVLTCMDARIDVFDLLGLQPGDAHVLRNGGGRVTEDVVRSLAVSQALLGTEEVMVIHHTDCGMSMHDDARMRAEVERVAGSRPDLDFLTFTDDAEAVREDVRQLRQSPYLRRSSVIRGFIYDIAQGTLGEVDPGQA